MKKILLTLIICFTLSICYAQVANKENPILFVEGSLGGAGGSISGFAGTFELNYQSNKNLFTVCYGGVINASSPNVVLAPINIHTNSAIEEFATLYGQRFINNNKSYSFSIGISSNKYSVYSAFSTANDTTLVTHFVGFPFELNIKWFRGTKKTDKNGLGGSFGIKAFGNLSKISFVGIAAVYGWGYHKHY